MKNIFYILLFMFVSVSISAQKYEFSTIIDLESSPVKNQGKTGTCWSFSTSSFIESEIMRITGKNIDISEMYIVRNTYDNKAWNYVMRQGKSQFSQGGLAHDVINAIRDNGLVPEIIFSGVKFEDKSYNHKKIVPEIKVVLDSFIKNPKLIDWQAKTAVILNKEIGKIPIKFRYENEEFTPKSFVEKLKINPNNYITLTSFKQVPFYTKFVLNIPDNFSNGSMYNMPINELVSVVNRALKKGYTLSLDVDVSEKTFSSKNGIAVMPKDIENQNKSLVEIVSELEVSQQYRQTKFENYQTTDDHLMHIVGLVKDQKGNNYYKVKNSWGSNSDRVGNDGYIYMSIPYFKLKAISVLLHKKGIARKIRCTLDL